MLINKELVLETSEIMKNYRKYVHLLELQDKGYLIFNDPDSKNKGKELFIFIDRVKYALEELNNEDKYFFTQEYLINPNCNNWWCSIYSRSTYYRHKASAIKHFLNLYHNLEI